MKLFGLEFTAKRITQQPLNSPRAWSTLIAHEPYTGAWQRNDELYGDDVRKFFAIYACITLISDDIAKMSPMVMRKDSKGIWEDVQNSPYLKVLKHPNNYQNTIQFRKWWLTSKLSTGNAYILKERDGSGNVIALHVLNPMRVEPLVTDFGDVYYRLNCDNLAKIEDNEIVVPSSEIVHDRYSPQYHPLVGVSPIWAAALAGALGLDIQSQAKKFFAGGSRIQGIITAPGAISKDMAERLEQGFAEKYMGPNASHRIAIMSDGLKFDPMQMTAVDAQTIEQLRLTAEIVCACFKVPTWKIGFGSQPAGKVEELNQMYYSDCIQVLVEEMEYCLDQCFSVRDGESIELNTEDLLRMDTGSMFAALGTGVDKAIMTPNEARKRVNLKPLVGGDTVYMQQQDYPLAQVAQNVIIPPPQTPAQPEPVVAEEEEQIDIERMFSELIAKELA